MEFDMVEHPGRFFSSLARDLKSLAISNIQFFQNGKQSYHAKFHMSFSLLYEYLDVGIEPSYRELSSHLNRFDFSTEMKGNGYRSLLQIVHKCCLHLLQLSRYISSVKDSILFRKRVYAKELEAYVSMLGQLRAVLYYALKLINYCQDGELFADEENINSEIADHLMMEVETLNQECFYGRCLGFQFCESMVRPIQIVNIAMASYSEGFLESSGVMQVATSVFNSGKYFMDPELRASQLAKVTRTADITFCKAFWSISENGLLQQLPSMVCPSVEVDEYFPLGPDAFELPLVDGSDSVVITPPCAHIGPGHVKVRLLSSHLREGQQFFRKPTKSKSPIVTKPRASGLLIHMHGGGFIAQSSKSHEVYLRDWAKNLDIPILSVDYSLAPELPFPRALEDCFYAYAWAVKNCEQLGSTGEKIVMAGDSAGGNLAISTAMRAASFGIRRPDGVLGVYPVTLVRYSPSPSRLLSLMDPLLPVGIMSRCLAAYAGIDEEHPLASPSVQEFQSEANLSSIKMQTVNSSDNEWVIIGQDEEECKQVDQRMDQSPNMESTSKSVIDTLENSFHADLEMSSDEGDGKISRSDTIESDEVEIFSQLQMAGSCVFPKDGSKENSKKKNNVPKDEVTMSNSKTSGGGKESESGISLSGIQDTAKSVFEGAHNMLTSLSSYIPSRSSLPVSTAENPQTSDPPCSTQPSDHPVKPRDDPDKVQGQDVCENDSVSVHCPPAVTAVHPTDGFDDKANFHLDNQVGSSVVKGQSVIFEEERGLDEDTCVIQEMEDDENDANFTMDEVSQTSSVHFDTAATSLTPESDVPPLPLNQEHNFHTMSPTSELSPLQEQMKPKLGLSPNVETDSPLTQGHVTNTTDLSLPSNRPTVDVSDNIPSVPSPSVSINSPPPGNDPQPLTPDDNLSINNPPLESTDHHDNSQISHSSKSSQSSSHENQQPLQATDPADDCQHNVTSKSEVTQSNGLVTQGPAKPPSDLSLATSTRNALPIPTSSKQCISSSSPSPNQIFLEDASDLESTDTDTDAAVFETSCLEFLGPASSPIETLASRPTLPEVEAQVVDGMFRSESAPALSAMLSPSPTESKENKSKSLFPNGFKMGMSPSDFKRQTFTPRSPVNYMRKALVVRNPYMSPLLADAELLQGLPPVCLVATHLDPLLDDSIMFAKKLRSLDMPVELHLIDDLSHGFLNFAMISPEAKKASQFCAYKILEMLKPDV